MALSRTIIKLARITRLPPWWIAFCDWITGREKKEKKKKLNELDFTGRHGVSYWLYFTACSSPFTWNSQTCEGPALAIGLPAPVLQSVEWSVSYFWQSDWVWEVRWVRVCSRWALVISWPRWQESSQVSPQECVCECISMCVLTEARLPWRHHPYRLCGCAFVGGWLGALVMFEYFCIRLTCVRRYASSAHTVSPCGLNVTFLCACVFVFARLFKCWCTARVQMWRLSRCWTVTPSPRWRRR